MAPMELGAGMPHAASAVTAPVAAVSNGNIVVGEAWNESVASAAPVASGAGAAPLIAAESTSLGACGGSSGGGHASCAVSPSGGRTDVDGGNGRRKSAVAASGDSTSASDAEDDGESCCDDSVPSSEGSTTASPTPAAATAAVVSELPASSSAGTGQAAAGSGSAVDSLGRGSRAADDADEAPRAVDALGQGNRAAEETDDDDDDDFELTEDAFSGTGREEVVTALAHVITQLASLGQRQQALTAFHARKPPRLSVKEYLDRLSTYYNCSDQCLLLGLIYIDRLVQMQPNFVVSTLSVHRLLMTSVMVATKFWDDVFYTNSYYAKVGGVSTAECCALEAQFLRMIRFRLSVSPREYAAYLNQVLFAARGVAATPPAASGAPAPQASSQMAQVGA